MKVRLTDRDVRMLAKCAVCRWLMTAQIHKLYFPDATLNAVQKRLRKLSVHGARSKAESSAVGESAFGEPGEGPSIFGGQLFDDALRP